MRNNEQFDEKQIYDRGKCFQISFFVALACVFISFFITDFLEIEVSKDIVFNFCIFVPLSVCIILFIIKDAFERVNDNTGKFLATLFGILGIAHIAIKVFFVITSGSDFLIENNEIGGLIASMIQSVCMLSISVVYFIKQYRNKKSLDEGD